MRNILFALILCLSPITADCCSCGMITFEEQIEKADLVLVGTVVSRVIRRPPGSDERFTGDEIAVHLLAVTKSYKGFRTTDTLAIESSADGNACGKVMNVGSAYIVYARFALDYSDRNNPVRTSTLVTSLCTRTRSTSDTTEIALLEAYRKSREEN